MSIQQQSTGTEQHRLGPWYIFSKGVSLWDASLRCWQGKCAQQEGELESCMGKLSSSSQLPTGLSIKVCVCHEEGLPRLAGSRRRTAREGADSCAACQREGLRRGSGVGPARGWDVGGIRAPCSQTGSQGCCGLTQLRVVMSGAEERAVHPTHSAPHPATQP